MVRIEIPLKFKMLNIPFKAFKMGAENKSETPVKYNKSRLSGSNKTTYNLHSKGACMPGDKEKFITTSKTKPEMNSDLLNNKNMKAFQVAKFDLYNYKFIDNKGKGKEYLEYKEFVPNDDDAFLTATNALYRHIFGNLFLMDSNKPIDLERRLRNGDITIKEFTRQICKSNAYRKNYFENISQYKSIKLRYKHILGRPIISQKEITYSAILLNELGFETHVDWLIDSEEYNKSFGEDIVPYMRSWNSSVGLKTKSFLETSSLTKYFATSDICSII